MSQLILAIDQGTTSSRAMIFAVDGGVVAKAQQEFKQYFPKNGWVEHDPLEIWDVTCRVCKEALSQLADINDVVGIGITNQRETTVVWHKETGQPVCQAIVWQDRRTADQCKTLKDAGHEGLISARTGLLIDPYFSATKLNWILENVEGARALSEEGKLAFGTIDSWLIWKFTNGVSHVTDASNASRTLLFNIHTQQWDEELLALFKVPKNVLPKVLDNSADFGLATVGLGGLQLPIAGVAGDQQAAMIGQSCFEPGMVKSTYGTGCFALMNLGYTAQKSNNRLLTTIAYRLAGKTTYALEGAIFVAGAAVQWLRDELGIIQQANETEALASSTDGNKGVYFVPAFTGLGAPHWCPHARGVIMGLTRNSGKAELARAALEAVCYQTRDLINAMGEDAGRRPALLRVDGGMIENNWLMQALANIVDLPVERPAMVESSALGAARLAGLQLNLFQSLDAVAKEWQADKRCENEINTSERNAMLDGWYKAVRACQVE